MTRTAFFLPLLLPALAGCSDRPRAPALANEAVYRNDAAGLRFLAPEGWTITSRAELPGGPLAKPVVLVSYLGTGEGRAELELLAAELPEAADAGRFLADYRVGSAKWEPKGPAEPLTINGAAATRYAFGRGAGKDEFRREATAFRRGGRVYVFLATFAASDPAARDAARKAVESATWSR